MKDKKIGQIIILVLFAVVCVAGLVWVLFGNRLKVANNENRVLSESPTLSADNYGKFSQDYTDYFNDHLLFKNSLVSMDSGINYFVFKSTSHGAVAGKGNWLFYCDYTTDGDVDTVADYKGTNLLTDAALKQIADNCTKQRDFLAQQGKEFVIMIVPDKSRIYPEYMPDQYGEPAENYRVKQIVDYLRENTDLKVVYPYEELMEAKNRVDYILYQRTDDHWNEIGAYVGASALLKELGIEMPAIDSEQIQIHEGEEMAGDLAGLLNLQNQLKFADHWYWITGYDEHDMKTNSEDFYTVFSYSAKNADPRKLYVVRDSFSTAMTPFLGSQFNDSYLRHHSTYSYEDFLSQDPDIVVCEMLEMYVMRLRSFSVDGTTTE